jgi:hypothetical protein
MSVATRRARSVARIRFSPDRNSELSLMSAMRMHEAGDVGVADVELGRRRAVREASRRTTLS